MNNPEKQSSYGRIIKSSSILGGASAINIIASIIRTKIIAIQLGPALVGVMSLYTSIITMVTSVASLGLDKSAVRDIAEASEKGDSIALAKTVKSLQRVIWITGIAGLFITVLMAGPLSYYTFHNYEHVAVIAALSINILLTQIQSGKMALLQGMRMIREVASVNIIGAFWSTIIAIPVLFILKADGIAPFLVAVAIGQTVTSWWFSRKVPLEHVTLSWNETFHFSRQMIGMGFALVVSGIAISSSTYFIYLLIQRNVGETGVGLYNAAFAISNVYVSFILQAMAGDYYPRLAGIGNDIEQRNKLVNEQTEIAVLLAIPGLIAALVFSDLLLWILYSEKFTGASTVLRWHVLGLLGRIISWPMGFILLARGDKNAFLISEIIGTLVHIGLVYFGVLYYGITGSGAAFTGLYIFYIILISSIVRVRHSYRWARVTVRLVLIGTGIVGVSFAVTFVKNDIYRYTAGMILVILGCFICIYGLYQRLGYERVDRIFQKIKCILS